MDSEERVLLALQPAWRSYFIFYTAIFIFGLGPLVNPQAGLNPVLGMVLALFLAIFVWHRRTTTYYRLTSKEVIRETKGWGQPQRQILPLAEIAAVEARRGIVQRFITVGHLRFKPRSTAYPEIWWFGVADSLQIKKEIERILTDAPVKSPLPVIPAKAGILN
jgi:membrane protein YdbS with pleckstrin-like domain